MANGDSFTSGFIALTGREPYAWQRRLYVDMMSGRMPDAVDLPTGLGKTSVIAIWLLARSDGAPVPRRLIYVVDRRAVVDQASAEADAISRRLSGDNEVMARLRSQLGLMSGGGLPVSTLRGQLADNRAWLQRPEGVAIVVGTVDMIGSRLLFCGYGVSRRMRPVHAALIGTDALIVLDEAHLVPPFEALLTSASALAAIFHLRAPLPIAPFQWLSLSATGRSRSGHRFSLNDADRADSPVAARLMAVKRLMLQPPVSIEALAEAMAAFAFSRAGAEGAIVVFCNSRKVAQAVARQLQSGTGNAKVAERRVELLVGERRVYERAALAASPVFARFNPERHLSTASPPALQGPAFLVATSAGEVGVDLDADHMVCDLVTWERMVQRLGRVNRRSQPAYAYVDVFPCLQAMDKDVEQPVTELDRLSAPFSSKAWQCDDEGRLDASPGALLRLREGPDFLQLAQRATSEAPLHPALTLAHLQAWAMTSLEQHAGRTLVAPWLRGWVDAEPECRAVWRALLPARPSGVPGADADTIDIDADFMLACPPHLSETLEAPTWRVAEVLKSRVKAFSLNAKARRDRPAHEADGSDRGRTRPICVVLLDANGGVSSALGLDRLVNTEVKKLALLFSGCTVVIDARLGGLDDDGLLDPKAAAVPRTMDDGQEWMPTLSTIGFRVRVPTVQPDIDPAWRVQATWYASEEDSEPALIVEVRRNLRSEEGDPALARWAQRLGEHQDWAGRHAAAIAMAVGLAPEGAQMLRLAAEVHDEGKRRVEWQTALGMRSDLGDAWAKSGRRRPPDVLDAGLADGQANPALMAGYRHEFGSVNDAATAAEGLPPASRDLFMHLIAAHHGFARPLINPHDPLRPPTLSATLAQEIALRYARLDAHWGPWGLAWWETVLKAADWYASAELNVNLTGEVGDV